MAINIQSLFSDIIETPAQKQRRLLEEGLIQASTIQPSSGLLRTGLARDIMRDMPRQREQFRRGVGGMLGLDVRTESEKLQDILRQSDTSDPQGMRGLARDIRQIAPAQAMTLLQAADEEERKRKVEAIDLESKQLALKAARNTESSIPLRIAAATDIVSGFDSNFASMMPFLYSNDPDGAARIAEQYAAGTGEGGIRQQKINDTFNILVSGGTPRDEAMEQAIKIVDGRITITPDPNNATRATLTDIIDKEVTVISNMPSPSANSMEEEEFQSMLQDSDLPSVLEMLQETTGMWNMAGEFFGRALESLTTLEGFTDEQKTEYVKGLKALENTVIRAFSLNDRYPDAEQQRIREQIAFKPEVFVGPEAAAARIAAVDKFMAQEVMNINQRLDNPEISPKQRSDDITLRDAILSYRDRLYPNTPDPSRMTPEVISNMSKERLRYFVRDVYSDSELADMSEETRQAIAEALR